MATDSDTPGKLPEGEIVGNPPNSPKFPATGEDGGTGVISAKEASKSNPLPPVAAGRRENRAEAEEAMSVGATDKDGMVKVHMAVTIPKMRGGDKWYSFEKGKVYRVPPSVKAALLKRPGLLKPTY